MPSETRQRRTMRRILAVLTFAAGPTALALLLIGATSATSSPWPASIPARQVPCLIGVHPNGESDRYCGDPAVVPAHTRVVRFPTVAQAKAVTRLCESEDGSGSRLPCRWDAQNEGNGIGDSFTVFSFGTPNRHGQPVVYVYDDGHVERGTV